MPRITICIAADETARKTLEAWFSRWSDEITEPLENQGCGCCIDMYDITVPWEAVKELPEDFLAYSDWAQWPQLNEQTQDIPDAKHEQNQAS